MKFSPRKVAFGGIACALSLACMFLSALVPFAEYTCPALAGIILIALVVDFGRRTAWIAYAAVAVLTIFITPNKEAAMLFIAFLGYYPIAKSSIERLKSRIAEWAVKLLLFNTACISGYAVIIVFFNMTQLLEDMSMGFAWGIYAFWVLANITFVVYDFALTRLIYIYCNTIRPRLRIR